MYAKVQRHSAKLALVCPSASTTGAVPHTCYRMHATDVVTISRAQDGKRLTQLYATALPCACSTALSRSHTVHTITHTWGDSLSVAP